MHEKSFRSTRLYFGSQKCCDLLVFHKAWRREQSYATLRPNMPHDGVCPGSGRIATRPAVRSEARNKLREARGFRVAARNIAVHFRDPPAPSGVVKVKPQDADLGCMCAVARCFRQDWMKTWRKSQQ